LPFIPFNTQEKAHGNMQKLFELQMVTQVASLMTQKASEEEVEKVQDQMRAALEKVCH
jgi:hypothetical protein